MLLNKALVRNIYFFDKNQPLTNFKRIGIGGILFLRFNFFTNKTTKNLSILFLILIFQDFLKIV